MAFRKLILYLENLSENAPDSLCNSKTFFKYIRGKKLTQQPVERLDNRDAKGALKDGGVLTISETDHHIDNIMADFNLTSSDPSTFILTGVPGLEAAHAWISIPFSVCYMISLLGNVTLLFVVGKEQTLHKPMYLLLWMLALADIGTSSSVVPKALCIFWFNLRGITVDGCLTQMFFLHMLSVMHSAVLVTMAFDRYVAICNPLRYTTILTNARIAKLGLVGLTRAVLFILPMPLLLSRLPFCASRLIPHTHCEPIAVAKLSCGDITVNRMYGLVIVFAVIGFDLTLITLSYGLIIRAILRISSKTAHQKALSTCTAHVSVMLTCYTSGLFSTLTHRFGQGIAPHIHIILADLYLLVPPMLNPIIYGVKTKELRDIVGQCICRRKKLIFSKKKTVV
nr:olfactory receptor 52K1-like [Pelodiscus sinensis]|eukprot:XP_025038562.1 olfactory receptor 52K1-like [Pelodiscus sinensis]